MNTLLQKLCYKYSVMNTLLQTLCYKNFATITLLQILCHERSATNTLLEEQKMTQKGMGVCMTLCHYIFTSSQTGI